MVELVYRPAALADLDAIYDFIEPDSPRKAVQFVHDIRAKCRLLCENPRLGPARDNIRPGLRIYPMFRRVVVCYRIAESTVVVVRVLYGGRDYEAILSDESDF